MTFRSILTTNEEAEFIRVNHLENFLSVDVDPEGEFINRMTGPSETLETINAALNAEGPNKIEN